MITQPAALRVVLVGTTHPGNIGGVARAMKNMGLADLHLVAPAVLPDESADARAAGAGDLLRAARVCDSVDEAIGDRDLVIATSARSRSLAWPSLTPRELARRLVTEEPASRPAVLFGPEHSGLANADVDRCQYLVSIPVDPGFPSLNLACAVQVIAYEVRLAWLESGAGAVLPATGAEPPASGEELANLFRHLEQVLLEVRFLRSRPSERLLRRIIRLLQRARLSQEEVNILRGVLTAVQRTLERAGRGNT